MRHIRVGTFNSTPLAKTLVNRVLDSGRLSYGPMSQDFERIFAKMHGCRFGVISNSGTSALLIALEALKEYYGWQDGDEVIVPAITFVATVNTVMQAGLTPVLVDVDSRTYCIAPDLILDAITPKTRAIIPVHAFGQPANMTEIVKIATEFNLRIIEDSCEAMGVYHGIKPVGSFGEVGCFSTYIAHLLVTGVGGMCTTNNPDIAEIMRSLVNHGIDLSELPTGEKYDASWLSRKFRFVRIGHSFRLTEFEAALGLAQINDLSGIVGVRRYNAAYLNDGLKDLAQLQLPIIGQSASMMYPIVCKAGGRNDFAGFLNSKGIETRLMLPLVSQPVYAGRWNPAAYPVAKWIDRNGLYIGCHQDLEKDELDFVIETVKEFWR